MPETQSNHIKVGPGRVLRKTSKSKSQKNSSVEEIYSSQELCALEARKILYIAVARLS